MIAILYAGYTLLMKTSAIFLENCKNALAKKEARDTNEFAYWDTNGAYRLTSNDKQIRYVRLPNGDRTIQTLNGTIVRNITKESRDADLAEKNEVLKTNGSPVKLLGRFCDICPDKLRKDKWYYVTKRTAVYEAADGGKYFREPTFDERCPKYSYISVENGKYTFLKETNEYEQKWLDAKNKQIGLVKPQRIHLSRNVDRMV